MADVQTEHGTTIANKLIEEVFMRGLLTKQQMQIVFTVIRESWGWRDRKRSTPQTTVKMKITRKPMKPKEFAERTGIHISDVCKILNGLVAAGVLRRHWDYYRFNKDFERWKLDETKTAKKNREIPQRARENPNRTKEDYGNSDVSMLGKNPNEVKVTRENPYSTREKPYQIEAEQLGKKPNGLGKNPNGTAENREIPQRTREIPQRNEGPNSENEGPKNSDSLGKNPNATRENPYCEWGKSLMEQPENPDGARDSGALNKKKLNLNKNNISPYLLSNLGSTGGRYGTDGLQDIVAYFETLRFTRKSGRLAESVIDRELDYWQRFDVDVVLLTLRLHRHKYPYQHEDYTRGIMRRMQKDKERGVNIHEQVDRQIGLREHSGSGQRPKAPGYAGTRSTAGPGSRRITDDDFDQLGIGV